MGEKVQTFEVELSWSTEPGMNGGKRHNAALLRLYGSVEDLYDVMREAEAVGLVVDRFTRRDAATVDDALAHLRALALVAAVQQPTKVPPAPPSQEEG
jgi:hypothetical protein